MTDNEFSMNREEAKMLYDLLNSLDDPESLVYNSFLHMMAIKPYIEIVYGYNRVKGERELVRSFKFRLNEQGNERVGFLSRFLFNK